MTTFIVKANRQRLFGAIVTLGALFGAASGVSAQQVHSWPGVECQATGSAQDLYYSSTGSIANRTAGTASAVCPALRVNGVAPWMLVAVFVRDRHAAQDITCTAQARDLTGVAGAGWSETKSTSGEGDQVLTFGAPGGPVPNYGPYSITCSLPPMVANLPSYIASYVVVEP